MATTYSKLKKISDKHGEIEFQAEISTETLDRYTANELAHYAAQATIPGFRKGNAPHDMVRERVGEMELLEGAANEALREAMLEIATDEKIDVLGRPELTVTKIAIKNPIEFKIKYAQAPEVSLPDYKKIAKAVMESKTDTTVTEEEMNQAITRLRTMTGWTPPKKEGEDAEKGKSGEKNEIPPLTDEEVKKFGPFPNAAAFRAELEKNLAQEKEMRGKEQKREEMIKKIVEGTKVKTPEMLIAQELREYTADRDRQLTEANITMDDYLARIKKTAKELETQEHELIERDIKTSLVIRAIRDKEALDPSEREVQLMIARLKLRYPDREEAALRRSAEASVIQEKLFTMLEGTVPQPQAQTPEPTTVQEKPQQPEEVKVEKEEKVNDKEDSSK